MFVKIFIPYFVLITLLINGCNLTGKGSQNTLDYEIDTARQVVMDFRFLIDPIPQLNEVSTLGVSIISRTSSDLDLDVTFITDDNYKLSSEDPVKLFLPSDGSASFKKEIWFTSDGPTGLFAIVNATFPNQRNFKKDLKIYFYIPEGGDDDSIPRVSKFPTEAHGSKKIEKAQMIDNIFSYIKQYL